MACELLYRPFQGIVLGDIDCVSCGSVEGWTLHVFRDGHKDVHVVSNALLLVVALHLYDESNFGIGGVLDDDVDCEERLDANVQTIAHEFELAIGRNEGDESLVLEATQPDALMELDIVELNCFVFGCPPLCLVVCLVVESQLEIGHS